MKNKRKSISSKSISQVLERVPDDDLRKFVAKILNEQNVKSKFLNHFEDYFMEEESADSYLEHIDEAYDDATSEYGYVYYKKMPELSRRMDDVIEAADKFRDRRNFTAAVEIYFAVIRNNVEVINESDDSYGYLGGIMRKAFDSLHSLTDSAVCTIDEEGRETFMDECLDCIEHKTFDGWDWHLDMYGFLVELANCEEDYKQIVKTMDADDKFLKGFHSGRAMVLKRDILTKWRGKKAGIEFMMQNLQVSDFRENVIRMAIENSNWQYAYKLCREGIELDGKNSAKSVDTWRHWMLKTAMNEGNRDIIIEYASLLFMADPNIQCDFYQILKDTVPADGWSDFTLKLAETARANRNSRYADICANEGWTEKLIEYVKLDGKICTIMKYQPHLLPKYSGEIVEMYIKYVFRMMDIHKHSRSVYETMCCYLKEACDIGGRERVDKAIADLRVRYRNCRALMEELEKV